MSNYRELIFNLITNLKRLDGIPINIEFVVPKELTKNTEVLYVKKDINLDVDNLYWYSKTFPDIKFEDVKLG